MDMAGTAVAVDIGGTFTDLAVRYPDGSTQTTKPLTTPGALADGVIEALQLSGVSAADVAFFVHGTTAGLNALLERKFAKVGLTVTISGSEIHLDLDGSAEQTGCCLNSGFAQTVSAARLVFKFLVNPETPATGGTFQCLQVSAPEGTIFAAKAPAACQYYNPHAGLMIDLFITLMAEALPERVTGAQCADPMNVMFSGTSPESGEPWMFGEATAIGWGASRTQDGENGLANYGGGDLKNYPAEVLESKYPILIDSYGLLPDSGGPGRRRGGLAIFRSFTALADSTLSLWLERTVTGPWGVFGGHQGGIPSGVLKCPDGTTRQLLKCSQMPFLAGSSLHVVTGGGGGYGDPAQREPDLAAADLADGYVTQHAARELYGHEGGQG